MLKRRFRFLVSLIFVFSFSVLHLNCGDKKTYNDDFQEDNSEETGEVNNTDGFSIKMAQGSELIEMLLMKVASTPTIGCSIPTTTQDNNDVSCILNMLEGAVYHNGFTFQINVPTSMCKYLKFRNYFYYNWEMGQAPSTARIVKKLDVDGNVDPSETKCYRDGVGDEHETNCYDDPELEFDLDSYTVSCKYNYSTLSVDYPNCCLGQTTLVVETRDDTNAVVEISPPEKLDWGGKYEGCLDGPAIFDSDWPRSKQGWPLGKRYFVDGIGINFNYTVSPPLTINPLAYNLLIANYYEIDFETGIGENVHTATPSGGAARTSYLPFAIDPIIDRSNSSLSATQDSYEFQCLDEADEIQQRIRVFVREWNTIEQFNLFKADPTLIDDHPDMSDVVGEEDSDCDYGITGDCDDSPDWKVMRVYFGQDAYDMNDPSKWELYFPRIPPAE